MRLNDNLVVIPVTFVSGVTGFCVKNVLQKTARLYLSVQTPVDNNTVVATLPQSVWSESNIIATTLAYQNGNIGRVAVTIGGGNGSINVGAVEYNLPISYVSVCMEWATAA